MVSFVLFSCVFAQEFSFIGFVGVFSPRVESGASSTFSEAVLQTLFLIIIIIIIIMMRMLHVLTVTEVRGEPLSELK